MKPFQTVFKFLAAFALAALAAGCASNNLIDKENVAVAAGFKAITPTRPEQLAHLQTLPVDRVTPITVAGKHYYILPDLANNRAYVGGPKQYGVYQQLRRKQETNSENAGNYESAPSDIQVVELNDMNWGEWGGWGDVGGPDGMGWPDWY